MTVLGVPLYPLLFILNEVVDDIYVSNNICLNPCKCKTLPFRQLLIFLNSLF